MNEEEVYVHSGTVDVNIDEVRQKYFVLRQGI